MDEVVEDNNDDDCDDVDEQEQKQEQDQEQEQEQEWEWVGSSVIVYIIFSILIPLGDGCFVNTGFLVSLQHSRF